MKNLVISLTILLAIVAVIILYGIYAGRVAGKLEAFSLSDKATSLSDADEAYDYWLKNKPFVHIGVSAAFADNITLGFIELRTALASNNTEEIAKAKEYLQFYLSELSRINCVNWENIL